MKNNAPGEGKRFPILGIDRRDIEKHPERPRNVPWAMLQPFEENAVRNHDQTLQRLAERGGLGATEMIAVMEGRGYRWIMEQPRDENECWLKLIEHIRQFEGIAATEIEFLRWFYAHAGEVVHEDTFMLEQMKKDFMKETGKELPKGYEFKD